jgi:hypothetical protein
MKSEDFIVKLREIDLRQANPDVTSQDLHFRLMSKYTQLGDELSLSEIMPVLRGTEIE